MNNSLRIILLAIVVALNVGISDAQVGINNNSPDPSSALDIASNNKGVLIPRLELLSTTDIATISTPSNSLLVYNTNTISDVYPGFYYWNTSEQKWIRFQGGANRKSVKYANTNTSTNLNQRESSNIDMPIFGSLKWNDDPALFVRSGNQVRVTQRGKYQIILHTYIDNKDINNGAAPWHQIEVNGSKVGARVICTLTRDDSSFTRDGAILNEVVELNVNDVITIFTGRDDSNGDDDKCTFVSSQTSNIIITKIGD